MHAKEEEKPNHQCLHPVFDGFVYRYNKVRPKQLTLTCWLQELNERCPHGQLTAVLCTTKSKIFFLNNSSETKLLIVCLRPLRNNQNTLLTIEPGYSTEHSCIQPVFKHNLAEFQGPVTRQLPDIVS
jgi:hypothetical protein